MLIPPGAYRSAFLGHAQCCFLKPRGPAPLATATEKLVPLSVPPWPLLPARCPLSRPPRSPSLPFGSGTSPSSVLRLQLHSGLPLPGARLCCSAVCAARGLKRISRPAAQEWGGPRCCCCCRCRCRGSTSLRFREGVSARDGSLGEGTRDPGAGEGGQVKLGKARVRGGGRCWEFRKGRGVVGVQGQDRGASPLLGRFANTHSPKPHLGLVRGAEYRSRTSPESGSLDGPCRRVLWNRRGPPRASFPQGGGQWSVL